MKDVKYHILFGQRCDCGACIVRPDGMSVHYEIKRKLPPKIIDQVYDGLIVEEHMRNMDVLRDRYPSTLIDGAYV